MEDVPERKRRPKGPQKSNATYQKEFWERRKFTHSRIVMVVTNEVKDDLELLSSVYGKTKTEVIEELIKTAKANCGFKDPL
ncbi:putative plasmid copy number control protein [Yersinia kristensenii]|uniref:RepB family protein n=1 Tax=Yersinia rochesterensis TaxID=1604335 RepID=UPI0005E695C6|nr:RepB family protein [Yersinia rochesterensis]MDR5020236.1 RepB family protein [Yersinia rochesterensis]CNI08337.1 putative plasmid copy number control protein [Yersinia kristensenii]